MAAAHCIQYKGASNALDANNLIVRLGKFDLKAANETGSVKRSVSRIDINPSWDILSDRWDSDIAILFMSERVSFSYTIKPICLPVDADIEDIHAGFVVSIEITTEVFSSDTLQNILTGWMGSK